MKHLFVLFLLLAPGLAVAQKASNQKEDSRPILYDDVTNRVAAIDRDAKTAFAGRFRIVEIQRNAGYQPMHLKGRPYVFTDPRSMRLWRVPFEMTYAYAVTAEGRALAPQILQTTDKETAKALVDSFRYNRYAPARLGGVPVACLEYGKIRFAKSPKDNLSYQNGLGIMGYRDR